MNETRELELAVARIERAMDEAYSRYARTAEPERVSGVAEALEQSIDSVPEALRAAALELLTDRYEPDGQHISDPALATELALLRAEVTRLRAEQETKRAPAGLVEAICAALLGQDGAAAISSAVPEPERIAAVVEALTGFASELAQAFLGTSDNQAAAAKNRERFRMSLCEQLEGVRDGALAEVLDEVKRHVGAHLGAVPKACKDGADLLLRALDPLLLEDDARASSPRIGGFEPFRFRELWRMFVRRYSELVADEDLYQTYFDPALRRAVHQQRQRGGHA